jgi:hypothetical protein
MIENDVVGFACDIGIELMFNLRAMSVLLVLLSLAACGTPSKKSEKKDEAKVRLLDGGTKNGVDAPLPRSEPPVLRDGGTEPVSDTGPPERRQPPERRTPPEPRPDNRPPPEREPVRVGWIGESCQDRSMCFYDEPVCLKESQGWVGGTCSKLCSKYCPDKTGQPVTFCINSMGAVPGSQGVCVQKCAFDRYPKTGCRTGYACKLMGRHNDNGTKAAVCVPPTANGPGVSGCYAQLQQQGVGFTIVPDPKGKPAGMPNLVCTVKDALRLSPTVHGVQWVTGGNKASSMLMRCQMALAIADFSRYLHSQGVRKVMHYGTYNCRAIRTDSGSTGSLSQHGLGLAIDIAAFWKADGSEYNLVKHWDHSTVWKNSRGQAGCWSTRFNSPQAKFLYEVACEMWKRRWFTLVLTPNYNKVHDNHFHVDLSSSGRIFASFPSVIQKHHAH